MVVVGWWLLDGGCWMVVVGWWLLDGMVVVGWLLLDLCFYGVL